MVGTIVIWPTRITWIVVGTHRNDQHVSLLKSGWNVELITVDDTKLRRDCVSNKKIANEKVEEGCTRWLNLARGGWNDSYLTNTYHMNCGWNAKEWPTRITFKKWLERWVDNCRWYQVEKRLCVEQKSSGWKSWGRMYKMIEFVEQKEEREAFSWSHQLRCLECALFLFRSFKLNLRSSSILSKTVSWLASLFFTSIESDWDLRFSIYHFLSEDSRI